MASTTEVSRQTDHLEETGKKPNFIEEVIAATPSEARLKICIQCGTCGGSCPSGPDMDYSPRQIFAMMAAGMREEVLSSNTPWFCVSCYYCMVRCPQKIHVTDIMYTLKRFSIDEGYAHPASASAAPGFSQTFIHYVENYGRSFELGVATWYHLTRHPNDMLKIAPFGLGMVQKRRVDFTPKKIKGIEQLKAILSTAKTLGGSI